MASSSSSVNKSRKRKHVVLPVESKIGILDRLKAGAIQTQLAEEYGIGSSTVGDIRKNEDKIRSFASTMDRMAMNKKVRKVMRLTYDDRLDEAV